MFFEVFLTHIFRCFHSKKSKREFIAKNGEEIGITSEEKHLNWEEIAINGEGILIAYAMKKPSILPDFTSKSREK